MKKETILFRIGIIVLLSLTTACSDWLDVKPKVAVNEEDLFSRELGFKEALTGLYIQMGDKSLYGREMTYGFLDGLAQRYRVDPETMDYTSADLYTYPSKMNEGYINSIWKNTYSIIANINNFLSWTDKNKEVITTPGYYELMKGEALGLRAFLYFDLLRLWGPVYQNNPDSLAIPYRTTFSREDKPLLPARVIVDSIINDLKRAEVLLEDDPMNIEFPTTAIKETTGLDDFLRYRFKRMNKYAVKAELARVYLWKYTGDRTDLEQAAAYASEVIEARDKNNKLYFQLVTDNSSDRILSTELIFALHINKFSDQVSSDFNLLSSSKYYATSRSFIENMFEVNIDGYNDFRIREGQGFVFEITGGYTMKYNQNGLSSTVIGNTIPLIRLSEMYYILAECSEDLGEAAKYLSKVRSARGVDDLERLANEQERLKQLEKEYRKDFYAEGQLWYFYKRHAWPRIYAHPVAYDFTDKNYVFPIPEDEVVLGILK